jgi:hypothetical protein
MLCASFSRLLPSLHAISLLSAFWCQSDQPIKRPSEGGLSKFTFAPKSPPQTVIIPDARTLAPGATVKGFLPRRANAAGYFYCPVFDFIPRARKPAG